MRFVYYRTYLAPPHGYCDVNHDQQPHRNQNPHRERVASASPLACPPRSISCWRRHCLQWRCCRWCWLWFRWRWCWRSWGEPDPRWACSGGTKLFLQEKKAKVDEETNEIPGADWSKEGWFCGVLYETMIMRLPIYTPGVHKELNTHKSNSTVWLAQFYSPNKNRAYQISVGFIHALGFTRWFPLNLIQTPTRPERSWRVASLEWNYISASLALRTLRLAGTRKIRDCQNWANKIIGFDGVQNFAWIPGVQIPIMRNRYRKVLLLYTGIRLVSLWRRKCVIGRDDSAFFSFHK